jgi:ubiquilin
MPGMMGPRPGVGGGAAPGTGAPGAPGAGGAPDMGALMDAMRRAGLAPPGGMGGMGAPPVPPVAPGAPRAPAADPRETFRAELEQMRNMGFVDEDACIRALQATSGNVQFAINRLLGE